MVRSDQQLVERMTLIWHDWFATTQRRRRRPAADARPERAVPRARARLVRRRSRSRSRRDPAMLVFLNGIENRKRPPERELRPRADGAVHARRRPRRVHRDRRPRARPRADRLARGLERRRRAARTSASTPTATTPARRRCGRARRTQRSGAFGWQDAVRLCLEHPLHRSFFVRKLWSYFIPTPPRRRRRRPRSRRSTSHSRLRRSARSSRRSCCTPTSTTARAAGQAAGRLHRRPAARARPRRSRRPRGRGCGDARRPAALPPAERLGLERPGVARHRRRCAAAGTSSTRCSTPSTLDPTPATRRPRRRAEALDKALAFWGHPTLTAETRAELERFADAALPADARDVGAAPRCAPTARTPCATSSPPPPTSRPA